MTTLRRSWTSFAIVSVPQEFGGRERRCAHPGTGPKDFGEHAAEARGTAARRGLGVPGERVLGTDARRGETVDRGTEANVARLHRGQAGRREHREPRALVGAARRFRERSAAARRTDTA